MLTITKDLDVIPSSAPVKIDLNQGDSDFQLVFNLKADKGELTIETGTTVAIQGVTSGGTAYTHTATIDTETAAVTVPGDGDITANAGSGLFELVLTHNEKTLHTNNFAIKIEAQPAVSGGS